MREAHRQEMVKREFEEVRALVPRIQNPELHQGFDELRFTAQEGPSGKSFIVVLELNEWNLQPPRLRLRNARSKQLLPLLQDWPRQSDFTFIEPHPETARPWCCMPGLREYHDHEQHKNDPWDLKRPHCRLVDIVLDITERLQRPRPPRPQVAPQAQPRRLP